MQYGTIIQNGEERRHKDPKRENIAVGLGIKISS